MHVGGKGELGSEGAPAQLGDPGNWEGEEKAESVQSPQSNSSAQQNYKELLASLTILGKLQWLSTLPTIDW